jgi:hypothetical protein
VSAPSSQVVTATALEEPKAVVMNASVAPRPAENQIRAIAPFDEGGGRQVNSNPPARRTVKAASARPSKGAAVEQQGQTTRNVKNARPAQPRPSRLTTFFKFGWFKRIVT